MDEVDDQGQNILMGIISQLRPGCDLSRITLPTFILERKSMLERITNQLQEPTLILDAHSTTDPLERFVKVVKWYMSCWHIIPKAVKKPLNPILGEYFTCYWNLPNGEKAYYVSEQTSHHPPKSSYFYMIPDSSIRVDGIVIPQSKFLGNSTAAMMEGMTRLTFQDILDSSNAPEYYTLTQPNMYARGILFGRMKFELGDHMVIKCPANDLEADIDFKTKGFISGTYNAIEGIIRNTSTGEILYEVTGKWNEVMELKNCQTKEKSTLFDCKKDANPMPPKVRSLAEQGDFESRKLWKNVTDALGERNHEKATDEKFAIENAQRERAKKREEDGSFFKPKLFRPLEGESAVDDGLEYIIYKDSELKEKLTPESVFSVAPVLPGQPFGEDFERPAEEK